MMAAAAAAGQQQGGPAGSGQAQANLTHAGLVGQQLGLPQNQQVSFPIHLIHFEKIEAIIIFEYRKKLFKLIK